MPAEETPRAAGCAALRAESAEPMHATAPERASSWLLVEHPGPWPSEELPPDLPGEAVAMLDRASAVGVRPQLIRPVGRRRTGPGTVVVASCVPGSTWLERRTVSDLRELADLDLDALAAGERPGFAETATDPVVLVCTHGRRDVCCARLGRPAAVLLDGQLPGLVWETTHVGGDRFAANVVCLPHGTYHGGIGVADVPDLAAAMVAGRVLLPRLRGRAGLSGAVQAADHFLRAECAVLDVDAVQPVAATTSRAGETCVELLVGAAARWCVHVRYGVPAAPRLTSCAGGGTTGQPASYELVSVRRLG